MFSAFPSPSPCATPLKPQNHALLAGFTRSHHTSRSPSTMRTDMTTEETGAIPVPSSARCTNFEKILTTRYDGLLRLAPAHRLPPTFFCRRLDFHGPCRETGIGDPAEHDI